MRAGPRWICAGVILPLALTLSASQGAIAEPGPEKQSEPEVAFAPEIEAKFKEFLGKLGAARRKRGAERMQQAIEEVKKVTGLDAESAKALEKPAQEAAEINCKEWLAKTEKAWRKQTWQPDQMLESLDQSLSQIELYAQAGAFGAEPDLTDVPAWQEALARVLTPAQAAAWKKSLEERREALLKEFGEVIKRSLEGMRERKLQAWQAKGAELKTGLGLSEARGKLVDALVKTVSEKSSEAWRNRVEKLLLAMPEVQRRQVAKQGNFYFVPEEADEQQQQAAWKEGLAQLFSPEEMKSLETAQANKKTRRIRMLGQMMLALYDEQVALTAAQREQLQPLAERVAKGEPSWFPERGSNDYFSFSPQSFFQAGSKARPADLEAALDPIQRQHWQEAAKAIDSRARGIRGRNAVTAAKPEEPVPAPEPEYFEQVLSDFLFEKAEAQRKRVHGTMILKAEDAARVAALSPVATARLQTAARGAAEESLAAWRVGLEEGLRSSLSDATARNVKQRLEGMEEYQYSRGSSVAPEKRPVWEKTIQTELTEAQRAAWQKEVDARSVFRERAIASLILAEFDRKHLLSTEQWAKLEPLITSFMKDYGPDIATMFSPANTSPWFLQSYSMFIPFAGISEKELKAVLGKEQWDRWAGSNEFSNTSNYWENIRGNHERRLKLPK
jgi:hypothetical protein